MASIWCMPHVSQCKRIECLSSIVACSNKTPMTRLNRLSIIVVSKRVDPFQNSCLDEIRVESRRCVSDVAFPGS
jgi:hypothetical protein